jgi:aarF domain-containing kinase
VEHGAHFLILYHPLPLPRPQVKDSAAALRLVHMGVQASLTQLLETGLLHGDPHPGNLMLTPSGRLAYLDFGLLCRVERKHSRALEALMVHLTASQWVSAAADMRQLELVKPSTTDAEVAAAMEEQMAGRYHPPPLGNALHSCDS